MKLGSSWPAVASTIRSIRGRGKLTFEQAWLTSVNDSCHSRCIGINKIYILNLTAVAKLLQYSGSRIEHKDVFSLYK